MWSVFKTFWRAIGEQFYRHHSGYFMFGFLFLFGVLKTSNVLQYHLSLMQGILSQYVLIAGVTALWVGYMLKALRFVREELQTEAYRFLHVFDALPAPTRWLIMGAAQTGIYLPVLLYALIMSGLAFYLGAWEKGLLILLIQVIILLVFSGLSLRLWRQFYTLSTPFLPFTIQWKRPPLFHLWAFIWQQKRWVFLGMKVFSIAILQLIFNLSERHFEIGYVPIALLLIAQAHSFLAWYLHRFLEEDYFFWRNLPLSRWKRYAIIAFTFALMVLPEYFILLLDACVSFGLALSGWLLVVSQLLFMFTLWYSYVSNVDYYTRWLIGLFLVTLYTTITSIEATIGVTLGCSFLLFYKNFYQFELE